jgi:hypothetical protein
MLRRAGARSTLAILGTDLCAASTVLLLVTQGVQGRVASSGSRLIASDRPDCGSSNEHQARPVSPGSNLATSQVLQVAHCASVAMSGPYYAWLVRVAQSPRRAPACSPDPSCTGRFPLLALSRRSWVVASLWRCWPCACCVALCVRAIRSAQQPSRDPSLHTRRLTQKDDRWRVAEWG